ncbi:ornithine carbamoyltransferase [Bacillus sp. FJAT-44742]|uniref:ornithine carbamoyltransferase n=1 Tax=Bacillus sp. FJAT-44742 TaxID=2014005 RepID=UPI000C234D1A|nr:ornithine carbamoyltransferase [Bacillus sp. FJAT-44742]
MQQQVQDKKAASLQGRDVLTLLDFTPEEIYALLQSAEELKAQQKEGKCPQLLAGKSLGMIFENSSTRTRVSFEVGMTQLGGHALFLSPRDLQIGRGEPIKDTAKVLSRYVDAIMVRTNSHEKVAELAEHADVPVINALTDWYHPCQALADLLTVKEQKETLKGLKTAFVGDGNNVAHSWMIACAKMGMDVYVATPSGYEPNKEVVKEVETIAASTNSKVVLTKDPVEAVKDADVIYTDVWASMGYEEEQTRREESFKGFQVNSDLVKNAKDDYIFLHCLPAHRGEEVSAEVIDGPQSMVYDEAENRLHVQKAILAATIK